MKPETALLFACRCCPSIHHYITSDLDAVAVEAAFRDGDAILSFQVIDAEGKVRTMNVRSEDIKNVQRAPLTPLERAKILRSMSGAAPLPSLKGKK
jgi:hypothetical protein